MGPGESAQRLLDAFLQGGPASLVQDELQGRSEDALRARDDPLHGSIALLLDRVRLGVGPVGLDDEVLELETGGQGSLRAQGGQLHARPRDVDPVIHEVSLAVERQERYEDARLRPVRQLLERDDADEAVA